MESEDFFKEVAYLLIKTTPKGKSVFANRPFDAGEFIIQFRGKIYTREEYLCKYNDRNNHFLQIDTDLWLGPTRTADNYVNHSCNPNCGIKIYEQHVLLFAIHDIKRYEELSFDYSTTMAEDCWEMDCLCGSRQCRKRIRDFKHLSPELRARYISLGIVPDFVIKSLG
ncbi:MAG TPA: SET domain-containing protein-lysine N-methyltransferase [Spirochaetota bacterium]|nr:SET domain-containing protein-lysine N-methyltransferase [Spirochaetota bacterium]HNT10753.1 SET domain-containing protein-lysine N-methyltransferase [Spirochaetota bacterium]HOS41857.1 SET domain-containing protein-lysine N-methyltransferase [Spirochaetota bacterium]HPU88786.1 SET domain-containing protein-lysine N-methyltransferase [Spirochaetota bacterium]